MISKNCLTHLRGLVRAAQVDGSISSASTVRATMPTYVQPLTHFAVSMPSISTIVCDNRGYANRADGTRRQPISPTSAVCHPHPDVNCCDTESNNTYHDHSVLFSNFGAITLCILPSQPPLLAATTRYTSSRSHLRRRCYTFRHCKHKMER